MSGVLARNEISREYEYNRKLFARTAHGYYVLNPALSVRVDDEWVPIYDRLQPPQIDRHLGHRERLEEIVAFQAFYARDPDAAIASLRARFDAEDELEVSPGPEPGPAGSRRVVSDNP